MLRCYLLPKRCLASNSKTIRSSERVIPYSKTTFLNWSYVRTCDQSFTYPKRLWLRLLKFFVSENLYSSHLVIPCPGSRTKTKFCLPIGRIGNSCDRAEDHGTTCLAGSTSRDFCYTKMFPYPRGPHQNSMNQRKTSWKSAKNWGFLSPKTLDLPPTKG